MLRWFREHGCVHCLARDAGVSRATGSRYLHEGIDVLAAPAPDPHQVLDQCRRAGMTHVILDGTLVETDHLVSVRDNGNDLWFNQKHKAFGGNVQFLAAPDGTPLWISDVEPGSTPDITAARIHAFPALDKAAADGLPTLADKGYIGTGIGSLVPVRCPKGQSEQALHTDMRTTNSLIRGVRALGERAAAREGIEMFTGFDSSTGAERLLLGCDGRRRRGPVLRIGAPASGRWKWLCDGDRAGPPVRLIGSVPEDVEPAVGEFRHLPNQGRLRDVRLGPGRRTGERAVGDAGRPGEVDGAPPSVRGPVRDEAGRRPEGAPVRPPFARPVGTVLRTHRPCGASGVTGDVRAPRPSG
ncbi:transposase family protein [Streptomyces sp. NPDC001812]|uniref:transposase family protein n=1 Tax=Streptomyces sp. NPDC001812 TaxID=3364611 RepID=UPI0036A2E05E